MPENTTGLSLAGVIKWLLVIAALPCLVRAWQGIVHRMTSTAYGSSGFDRSQLLTGNAAVWFGVENLLIAAILIAVAWAVWYFWQQYED